jgi:hypothetical protein
MADNVIPHPRRAVMTEAAIERQVADSPEGAALQETIVKAVEEYAKFLDRHGLIYDADKDLLKASALIVTKDFGSADDAVVITLKDAAIDRVYNGGSDPDPTGSGQNPT